MYHLTCIGCVGEKTRLRIAGFFEIRLLHRTISVRFICQFAQCQRLLANNVTNFVSTAAFFGALKKKTFSRWVSSWESRKLDFDDYLGPGSRLPRDRAVYYTAKLLGNGWRLGAKRIIDSQNVVTTVTNFLDASHTSGLDTSSATFRTARKLWNVPPKKKH